MNAKPNVKNSTCPVCDSPELLSFLKILDVPVHCNILYRTYEDAVRAPRGNIQLAFCLTCGHIFNLDFNPELMKYSQDYESSLHFSPSFQEYAKSLVTRLISEYEMRDKDVIEIGCGKGDFLKLLCDLGKNRGVGFDRSYVPGRDNDGSGGRVTFVKDFYSERYAGYQMDLIVCRHVLEHIQSPGPFMESIRRTIGRRLNTIVFFEVPNVMFTLKDFGIWDLIYEHCGYFSIHSLSFLFESTGFKVMRLENEFEGQFLAIDALPVEHLSPHNTNHLNGIQEMGNYVANFSSNYNAKIEEWRVTLRKMKEGGKRTVLWGAGSKGVTFLNTLNIKEEIAYIVDINPHKQGKHVPGSTQKIIPPNYLTEYRPDKVIVMNPIYFDEIRKTIGQMGLSASVRVV